jgi:magnesium-protoporphyrin O-methyltransferase
VAGATVLDLGGGIGALTFELLKLGASRATVVEAAAAYLEAAMQEATRIEKRDVIEFKHGDFLEIAQELPATAVVTLDRVICCYPYYEPFLVEALRHADRVFAMSYPRDRWFVRLAVGLENAMRKRRCSFRTFVHPVADMQRIIREAGFELTSRTQTAVWSADLFVRRPGNHSQAPVH